MAKGMRPPLFCSQAGKGKKRKDQNRENGFSDLMAWICLAGWKKWMQKWAETNRITKSMQNFFPKNILCRILAET